jgi:hypothetical protein
MSIRWIKNILIDGVKSTIEIQLGDKRIGDKCYTRVTGEMERWFETSSAVRDEVIEQGVDLLKQRLRGKRLTHPDGKVFEWR